MLEPLSAALAGRYRVEQPVGRGGMATVYRAVDLRHDRTVAVKVMNAEFAETVGRDRFLREIKVTAGLTHPHLLALYDSGEVGDQLFYVTPFVEGISLRERLVAARRLPLAEAFKIAREVASALSYAHARGIVHRDIKPENILLTADPAGDTRHTWNTLVADFGIAQMTATRGDHLTITGVAVGSAQYMSPEQATGDHVDKRTDIWALGCVVYEMLEGVAPRGVPSFQRRDVPPAAQAAVLRALAHDPAARFADASDFADALVESPRAAPRRWIAWMGGMAAAVLAIALVSSGLRPTVQRGMSRDSVAMDFYRRATANVNLRNAPTIIEAVGEYAQAIGRDSGFTLAWAGLARSAQMAHLRGFIPPGFTPDSLLAVAVRAGERAVNLDSGLAEVWIVRARVLESVDPTSRALVLNDLRRALAIDSMNGDAWFALGRAREELLDSAGARVAYTRAARLAPKNTELLAFFALHYLWTGEPAKGVPWADSAVALAPTYLLARDATVLLAMELRDWASAERHMRAHERLAQGPDAVTSLGHAARLALLQGDLAGARRLAREAERRVDSTRLTKHESAYLGEAFSAAGDTARAFRWITAFSPRNDLHFQLHLHRDPALVWLRDPRYRSVLTPEPAPGASAP